LKISTYIKFKSKEANVPHEFGKSWSDWAKGESRHSSWSESFRN
jgi:hypothetical protein